MICSCHDYVRIIEILYIKCRFLHVECGPLFVNKLLLFTDGLLVLTVATEETDGFRRFLRSARIYNLNVEVRTSARGTRGLHLLR